MMVVGQYMYMLSLSLLALRQRPGLISKRKVAAGRRHHLRLKLVVRVI